MDWTLLSGADLECVAHTNWGRDMVRSHRVTLIVAATAGLLVAGPPAASAAKAPPPAFVVYSAYADCPIPPGEGCYGSGKSSKPTNPAFPSPWFGTKGFVFEANPNEMDLTLTTDPDASVVRIVNSSKAALSVEDVAVATCNGGTLDLWGTSPYAYPYTVPAKGQIAFSSTGGENFDGSDGCSAAPTVTVLINGVSSSYPDAIANGGQGAIPGSKVFDESTPWTKISPGKSKVSIFPAKLAAKVGVSYQQQLYADGTNGAPTYTATGLPPGVSLSAAGELAGTPTEAGTFKATVHVEDTAVPADAASKKYKFVVKA